MTVIPWSAVEGGINRAVTLGALAGAERSLLVNSQGDMVATDSLIKGNNLTIQFSGRIGMIDVSGTISVDYDPKAKEVALTAELEQPIQLGPFEWHIPVGNKGSETTLRIVSPTGTSSACAIKCAGDLAPVVIACLDELPNVGKFLDCLKKGLSKDIWKIILCIIKCAI